MQSLPFVQIYDIKNFAADDSEVRITAFLRARTLTRFTEPEGRVIYPTPWSWHSQGFFSSEPSSRYISTAWAPFVNPTEREYIHISITFKRTSYGSRSPLQIPCSTLF